MQPSGPGRVARATVAASTRPVGASLAFRRLGVARRKLATYRSWPWQQRALALEMVLVALGVEVLLRFLPHDRLLEPWARLARGDIVRRLLLTGSPLTAAERYRVVAVAAHLLRPGRSCLLRSVLLWGDLVARDLDATLVIGVSLVPAFTAHAWVETGGTPAAESEAATHAFTPVAAWDASGLLMAAGGAFHGGRRPATESAESAESADRN